MNFRHLPSLIDDLGGVKDTLKQPFGFNLPICNLREGYSRSSVSQTQIVFMKLIKDIVAFVPAFTDVGFHKREIPERLFFDLLKFRNLSLIKGNLKPETLDFGVINGPTVIENEKLEKSKEIIVNRTQIIELDQQIKEQIFMTLGPMAEEWSNLKLIPTSIYGIRRYRNQSCNKDSSKILGGLCKGAVIEAEGRLDTESMIL